MIPLSSPRSDCVEMWERIWFAANEPVKWERSWDKGKTWEPVNWPGENLPFVLFNAANVDFVIEKKLLPASSPGSGSAEARR